MHSLVLNVKMHHLKQQITGANKCIMYILMTAHMCMVFCSESHKAQVRRLSGDMSVKSERLKGELATDI